MWSHAAEVYLPAGKKRQKVGKSTNANINTVSTNAITLLDTSILDTWIPQPNTSQIVGGKTSRLNE